MIKNSLLLALLASASIFTACNNAKTETSETTETTATETVTAAVDAAASTINWKGTMLGMYSHEGTVAISDAALMMAGDKISGGNFVVDMATITPTDQNYEAEGQRTAANLVGHLSSPDFFDVANNPTARFEITSVSEDGTSAKGNLTLRGKTNEETVEGISFDAATKTASGTMKIDRQKYDVAYKASMKDMVLSDEIELNLSIKAN
jgi:polyisoprenoid-binding protein YceI